LVEGGEKGCESGLVVRDEVESESRVKRVAWRMCPRRLRLRSDWRGARRTLEMYDEIVKWEWGL
jgi:hypothetical protein